MAELKDKDVSIEDLLLQVNVQRPNPFEAMHYQTYCQSCAKTDGCLVYDKMSRSYDFYRPDRKQTN